MISVWLNKLENRFHLVERRGALKEFAVFASSTLWQQATRFGTNLIAATHLGPANWGLWQILSLILMYGPNAHLGTLNGMNREVPLLKGQGEPEKALRAQSASLGFLLMTTILTTLVFAGAMARWAPPHLTHLTFHLLPLFMLTQFYIWLQIYLKSNAQFALVSKQLFVFALLLAGLAIPLTLWQGLVGFIWGQFFATLGTILLILRTFPIDIMPRVDWAESWRLIRVGAPIMVVGLLFTLMTTVDRWAITTFLGAEQLGFYSISLMASSILNMLPTVVAEQIYPRMVEAWGRTRQVAIVRTWTVRQILLSSAVTLVAIVPVAIAAPWGVSLFLPKFLPGLPAIYPMLLPPLFLALAGGFGNALNTLSKQHIYLAVQAASLPVLVAVTFVFIKAGWGIVGVAWANAVAFGLYALGLAIVGLWTMRRIETSKEGNP